MPCIGTAVVNSPLPFEFVNEQSESVFRCLTVGQLVRSGDLLKYLAPAKFPSAIVFDPLGQVPDRCVDSTRARGSA